MGRLYGAFSGGASSSHFSFYCDYSVSEGSSTSTVYLDWYVARNDNYTTYKNPARWTQTVDGSTESGSVNFSISSASQPVHVWSSTVTVYNGWTSISGTFDLSGTSAGTASLSDSIYVGSYEPSIVLPTVSALAITDATTTYSTVGAYLAGKSKITLTATATKGTYNIGSYKWYKGNNLVATTNTNTYTFSSAETSTGSVTYKVIAVDIYDNQSTAKSASVTFSAYSAPKITSATAVRTGSDNKSVSANMTFTYSAVGSNTLTVKKVVVNNVTGNFSSSGTAITVAANLATTSNYTAVFTVTDKLGSSATYNVTIYKTGIPGIDLYPSTVGGMGIGTTAENNKLIIAYPTTLQSTISVAGNATFSGNVTASNGKGTFRELAVTTAIPIGSGGTGLSSSPSMLTNLGSTSADNVLKASPRPGVTGTLGVGNGGTGVTSLSALKDALGINGGGTNDLLNGTLTASSGSVSFDTDSSYKAYIFCGYPGSSSTHGMVSTIIPAKALSGQWQIADDGGFVKFNVSNGSISWASGTSGGQITTCYAV